METTDRSRAGGESAPDEERPLVKALSSSEERTVFTESGNDDGWIATDLTVEATR